MGKALTITYDHVGDILYVDLEPSRPDEDTSEWAPGVVVRADRETGAVLGFEVQRFTKHAACGEGLTLPIEAELALRKVG